MRRSLAGQFGHLNSQYLPGEWGYHMRRRSPHPPSRRNANMLFPEIKFDLSGDNCLREIKLGNFGDEFSQR